MMTRPILAALLAISVMSGQATAQTPLPGNSHPSDAEAPERKIEPKRALAAKLAGLVGFANASCDDVKGDPALLKDSVRRMGVEPDELEKGELYMVATSYIENYRKDAPANCKRALETFGPGSRIVPNLIVKR